MFPWPAVIGAAASLGGSAMGLFGKGQGGQSTDWSYANWQAQRDDTYLQRRVADGAAAGLSPLASIGATGGGGGIPQPVQGGSMGPQMEWGETGSHIGNAIKEILESPEIQRQKAMRSRMDDIALRQAEADLDLTRARSRSIIEEARHPTRGFAQDPATSVSNPNRPDKVTQVHNPFVKLKVDKRYSDAQDAQNRYGEPGEWVQGIGNMWTDSLNARNPDRQRGYQKGWSDVWKKKFQPMLDWWQKYSSGAGSTLP